MRAPRTVRRLSTDVVVIEEGKSTATSWRINKRNGLLNKNNWISCSRKSLPRPLNPDFSTSSPMDEPSPPCSSTDHPWRDENANGAGNGWNHLSKDDEWGMKGRIGVVRSIILVLFGSSRFSSHYPAREIFPPTDMTQKRRSPASATSSPATIPGIVFPRSRCRPMGAIKWLHFYLINCDIYSLACSYIRSISVHTRVHNTGVAGKSGSKLGSSLQLRHIGDKKCSIEKFAFPFPWSGKLLPTEETIIHIISGKLFRFWIALKRQVPIHSVGSEFELLSRWWLSRQLCHKLGGRARPRTNPWRGCQWI